MIVRDDEKNWVGIKCDQCERVAPPASEILAGHGLVNMGWYCRGGVHICPAHDHPRERR